MSFVSIVCLCPIFRKGIPNGSSLSERIQCCFKVKSTEFSVDSIDQDDRQVRWLRWFFSEKDHSFPQSQKRVSKSFPVDKTMLESSKFVTSALSWRSLKNGKAAYRFVNTAYQSWYLHSLLESCVNTLIVHLNIAHPSTDQATKKLPSVSRARSFRVIGMKCLACFVWHSCLSLQL